MLQSLTCQTPLAVVRGLASLPASHAAFATSGSFCELALRPPAANSDIAQQLTSGGGLRKGDIPQKAKDSGNLARHWHTNIPFPVLNGSHVHPNLLRNVVLK